MVSCMSGYIQIPGDIIISPLIAPGFVIPYLSPVYLLKSPGMPARLYT